MKSLLVKTMQGLGDAIAARPTIAAILRGGRGYEQIFIETPWPQVFADISATHPFAGFVRPSDTTLRAQQRNVNEVDRLGSLGFWEGVDPGDHDTIQLKYVLEPGKKSIPEQIAESAFVADANPDDLFFREAEWPRTRMGIFRQATVRREYTNPARNPAPGAIASIVRAFRDVEWLHVNDLQVGNEELAETRLHGPAEAVLGQFSIPTIMQLLRRAKCVLSPVSGLMWAGIAFKRPTMVVWGGFAPPETILGTYASEAVILKPAPGCYCFDRLHDCGDAKKFETAAVDAAIREFEARIRT